jgi:hypothetical protein
MRQTKAFLMLTMMLLIALAAGAPDEATGQVTKVVDGDTADIPVIIRYLVNKVTI